jgi:hypothetical protein
MAASCSIRGTPACITYLAPGIKGALALGDDQLLTNPNKAGIGDPVRGS